MVSDYYQEKITGTPLAAVLAGDSSSTAISAQATDTVESSTATASSEGVVDKQIASLQLGQLPALVLVCAHKRRDKRCGLAGPMLIDEFRRGVEAKGLSGQVHVIAVSHIGGACRISPGYHTFTLPIYVACRVHEPFFVGAVTSGLNACCSHQDTSSTNLTMRLRTLCKLVTIYCIYIAQ